ELLVQDRSTTNLGRGVSRVRQTPQSSERCTELKISKSSSLGVNLNNENAIQCPDRELQSLPRVVRSNTHKNAHLHSESSWNPQSEFCLCIFLITVVLPLELTFDSLRRGVRGQDSIVIAESSHHLR